jgi:Membrane-bound serine protease (ClpP class)
LFHYDCGERRGNGPGNDNWRGTSGLDRRVSQWRREKTDETMKQKLENFSVSYIETIAGKRQRNVDWAKSAVKESASITAEKALQLKVVDLIASDISDLLQKLNGRLVDGKTLKTAGAEVSEIKMSASEHVFQKLLATRSDVHSHADRDLWNHWRDDHARSDSSWSRWSNRASPGALSGGCFAGQRHRPRPDRPRVDALHFLTFMQRHTGS